MPSVRELLAQYNNKTPSMNLTQYELELLIDMYIKLNGAAANRDILDENVQIETFQKKDKYEELYEYIRYHIDDIRPQERPDTRERPPPPSVGGRRKKTRRRKSRRRRSRKPVY